MSSKNVYQITKTKKLIDLNGEMTNFDITFKVTSKDNKPYDLLVVDQATLDSENSPLQYKRVQGEISGNVTSDKNAFQNYYLILKADEPCECEIEIIKKELAISVPEPPPELLKAPVPLPPVRKDTNWGKVAIVFGCVVGIGIVFYILTRKDEGKNSNVEVEPTRIVPEIPMPTTTILAPPENPLLTRLKNLNIPK
jgi:hypothetical protein